MLYSNYQGFQNIPGWPELASAHERLADATDQALMHVGQAYAIRGRLEIPPGEPGSITTPVLRSALEVQVGQLNVRLGAIDEPLAQVVEIGARPELQDGIAHVGLTALSGLRELSEVEELLPPEQTLELGANFEVEARGAATFFEDHGTRRVEDRPEVISSGESFMRAYQDWETTHGFRYSVPDSLDTPRDSLSVVEGPEILLGPAEDFTTIGVSEQGLIVGEGDLVPFKANFSSMYSYDAGALRNAVLKKLAHTPGEMVSRAQLEEALSSNPILEGVPDPSRAIRGALSWLEGLEVEDGPLIIGVLSSSSGEKMYGVPPHIRLQAVEALASPTFAPEATEGLSLPEEAGIEDLYFAARHLYRAHELLETSGLPRINEEAVSVLATYAPDLTDLRNDAEALIGVHREAIDRVINLLREPEAILEFGARTEEPVVHELLTQFLDMEPKARDYYIALLGAAEKTSPVIDTDYRQGGVVQGVKHQFIDPFGVPIGPLERLPENTPRYLLVRDLDDSASTRLVEDYGPATPRADPSISQPPGTRTGPEEPSLTLPLTEAPPRAVAPSAPEASVAPKEKRQESSAEREARLLADMTRVVEGIVSTLWDGDIRPGKVYGRDQLQAVVRGLNKTRAARAEENGVGPSAQGGGYRDYSFEDTVRVLAYSHDPNRYKQFGPQIETMIRKKIDAKIAESEGQSR